MYTIVTPPARRRSISPNSAVASRRVRTAVGSSASQHRCVTRQCLGDLDNLPIGNRQRPDHRPRINRTGYAGQITAGLRDHRRAIKQGKSGDLPPEVNIHRHAQFVHEIQFLVDHGDTSFCAWDTPVNFSTRPLISTRPSVGHRGQQDFH